MQAQDDMMKMQENRTNGNNARTFSATVNQASLELLVGDITLQNTDAIVNAANESLFAGGGVCGAIHVACGAKPFDECKRLYPDGISVGQAVVTSGGKKPYKIIHAVGPVWSHNAKGLDAYLDATYWNALCVATENGVASIAFPSISTGIFGYPIEQAANIALRAVIEYLSDGNHGLSLVRFVLFDTDSFETYWRTLRTVQREVQRGHGK